MKIRITVGVDERYYGDEDEVVNALRKHAIARERMWSKGQIWCLDS